MALPTPLTIAETLNAIVANLSQWAAQYSGTAAGVSNLSELWNQSSINSQVPRILVCFTGEQSRGDFGNIAAWHRVDREFTIAVTKGRGYFSNRGDSLSNPNVVELPFLDALEQVRDQWRSMLGISEELPTIDYRQMRPMQMGNLVVDGYLIIGTLAADIPFIGTQPQNPTS
jgi:hypothetical protein